MATLTRCRATIEALRGLAAVRALAKAGYTLDGLAISHISRYYLDMLLRFDWDERKNKSNRIKHVGLKRPRAFSAIPMDAYFMIQSIPRVRIGSFSSV